MGEKNEYQNAPPRSTVYRADIDGLRAVAVIAVVLFHGFPTFLPGGFVGVDVFFVISGYLITHVLMGQIKDGQPFIKKFYLARARRILPALVTVLICCLAIGWFVLGARDFDRLGTHAAAGAAFVSNLLLARELGYFQPTAQATPLLHLWSLAIEEQFYLIWPAVLWMVLRTQHSGRFILAMILGSMAISIHSIINEPDRAFYSSFGRWWELMIGAYLAHQEHRGKAIWLQLGKLVASGVTIVGLILIGTSAFFLDSEVLFPGPTAMWPTIGAALVICGAGNQLLEHKSAVFIGKISFPLYLWHWPLIAFSSQVFMEPVTTSEMIGILLGSLVLAAITYWYIETPIRQGSMNVRVPFATAFTFLAIASVGLASFDALTRPKRERLDQMVKAIHLQGEMPNSWRDQECFLTTDSKTSFQTCKTTGPTVAIWGDSHAAALYPGLLEQGRAHGVNVALYAVAGCPPSVTDGRSKCFPLQSSALREIGLLKPQAVVLHARWGRYQDPALTTESVAALRRIGIKKIIVVGPVPHWHKRLTQMVGSHLRRTGVLPSHRIPEAASFDSEPLVRRLALDSGATYLSAAELLCNADGCLAWTGKDVATLLYWDDSHLSEAGSMLLAREFSKTVFPERP